MFDIFLAYLGGRVFGYWESAHALRAGYLGEEKRS
jgi:hypothetical protein